MREMSDDERFDSRWTLDPETGCHVWTRGKDGSGYGQFSFIGGSMIRAHVYAWVRAHGPVPKGLQLDHFACDNKACCNPAHLRPVTRRENILRSNSASALHARQTHCVHGHEFTPENTYVRAGGRACRACKRRRDKAWRDKVAALRSPQGPKTHCARGHELTAENTYIRPDSGGRMCRTCSALRELRRRGVRSQRTQGAAAGAPGHDVAPVVIPVEAG